MSTTIDQRVVEMRFDNKQFEENVAESISTLDKLKGALNFDKISDTFGAVTKAAEKVDFSPISDGVETVMVKFNMLEVAAVAALTNIVNKGINVLENAIKGVSVDQVTAGWDKLEDKTKSVQTIMAATGKDIGEVSEQLDRLNWFSDETSYSFTDMTSNVGKFTSVGVQLEDAVSAMEGIATWAALSGGGASEASRAMYNLSQAMGVGAVKLMDWRSIENAGMATQEFKEIVLDTAAAMGTLNKFADGTYQTIEKGTNVTVKDFNSALSEGWFSSEVLMAALENYGGFANELSKACEETGILTSDFIGYIEEYTAGTLDMSKIVEETKMSSEDLIPIFEKLSGAEYELGRKAFRAAQEAKTLSDVLDATRDAVSTKWMNVFENIFGDYEEAKGFYTDMANQFYDMFADPIDKLNDFIISWDELYQLMEDGTKRQMGEVFRTGIIDFLQTANNLLNILKTTLAKVIPPITADQLAKLTIRFGEAMKSAKEFTAGFEVSSDVTNRLASVWRGFTSVLGIGKDLFDALKPTISDIAKFIGSLADDILTLSARFGDWLGDMRDYLRENQAFETAIQKIREHLTPVTDKLKEFYAQFKQKIAIGEFESFESIIGRIKEKLAPVCESLQKFYKGDPESEGSSGLKQVLTDIWNLIKNIGDSVKNLFSGIDLNGILGDLNNLLRSIGKGLKDILKNFSFGSVFEGLSKGINSVSDAVANADLSGLFSNLAKGSMIFGTFNLGKLFGNAAGALGGVKKDGIAGIFSPITDVFGQLKETIGSFTRDTDDGKLKAIATAIAVLTASLFVLSGVDTNKIDSGLKGIGGALAEMLGSVYVLSKMDLSGGKQMKNVATAMIELAAACWIMSKAITPFATMNGDQLAKAGAAMTVILGEFLAFIAIFGDISKSNTKGIFKVSNGFDKQIIKAAEAMILLGAAVKVFASAAKDFASMKWEDLAKAGAAITVLLAEFAGFSALASKFDSGKLIGIGFAMIELGAAMAIFSGVAKNFGGMQGEEFIRAIGGMTLVMAELVGFMAASTYLVDSGGKLAAVAASMILLGVAMEEFAAVAFIVSKIDIETFSNSMAFLVVALAEMGVFMVLASAFKQDVLAIAGIAASMIVLGMAFETFAASAMMFSAVNWESMAKMGVVFGVLAAAMVLMAPVLPAIGAGLTSVGVGLIAVGAGITLIGTGIAALNLGLMMSSLARIGSELALIGQDIKAALSIEVILQFLAALPKIMTGMISGLIAGLIEGVGIILGSLGTLIDGFKTMVVALLDAVVELSPKLIETVLKILVDIIASLADHVPEMLESVLSLILRLLDGLGQYVPDIVTSLVNLLVKAIDSLTEHIPTLLTSSLKFLDALLGEILNTIRTLFTESKEGAESTVGLPKLGKELSDFWKNIEPFIEGVKGLKKEDLDAVASIATAVLALTAAEVLDGMSAWFGKKKDAEEFGDSLVNFAPKLKQFGEIMKGVDAELIKNAGIAIAAIAEAFSSETFKTGGVIQWIKGEMTDLEQLGIKLVAIAPKFREFENTMKGTDPEDVKRSAESVKTIASAFNENSFKTGGIVQLFKGEMTDLEKLGNSLVAIAPKLREFETLMTGTDPEQVKVAAQTVQTIAEAFNEKTFKTGGLSQWMSGELDLNKFIENITAFGKGISDFYTSIADVDTERISSMISALKDILGLANGKGELKATIDKSFGESMKKIAQAGIDDFITVIVNAAMSIQVSAKTLMDKFITAVSGKRGDAENAFNAVLNALLNAAKLKQENFRMTGVSLITSLTLGIKAETENVKAAANAVVTAAIDEIGNQVVLFYNSGADVMNGFILGMQSKAELVSENAGKLGTTALDAMANILDEHSPSKAFFKLGAFGAEGFVNGLNSFLESAGDAAAALGDRSLLTISGIIEDFLQNEIETDPVIRPVLDLSDIETGSRRLNAMMSSDLAYSASDDISESGGGFGYSSVDNSRSFGGFTFNIYPQSTDAEGIAEELGADLVRRLRLFSTI